MSNIYTTEAEDKFVNKKRTNTKSDLIEITEDKLENILLKNYRYIKLKKSWLSPLSLFLTFLVSKLTSDFKDFVGISKNTWSDLFIIAIIISFIWLIRSVYCLFINKEKTTLQYLLELIKNTHASSDNAEFE